MLDKEGRLTKVIKRSFGDHKGATNAYRQAGKKSWENAVICEL